jgi:hypothetical protein
MPRAFTLLLAAVLLASGVCAVALENHDPIPQGDFAVLLADRANFPDPPGGWTPATAIAALKTIHITPFSGFWEPDVILNERNLVHIFRHFGITLYTVDPNHKVTLLRAAMLLNLYRRMFYHHLWAESTSEITTTHIDTGIGGDIAGVLPRPPASPSTPCCPCSCEDSSCLERYGLIPPRK